MTAELTPTFSGEMQLAGWSESHTGGAKVTFWLPDPDDLDVFRGLTARKGNTAGHRFAAVLVEIGDDERPAQGPQTPAYADNGDNPPSPQRIGPLARLAGIWCKSEGFRAFLLHEYGAQCFTEDGAASAVRELCGIESRRELDESPAAAERFHAALRLRFMDWRRQHPEYDDE